MNKIKIVLASASPRRRELLSQIGIGFEVRVSHVQEEVTAVEPGLVVEELARQKAEAVLKEIVGTENMQGANMVKEDALVASGAMEGVLVPDGAAESVLVSGGTVEGVLVPDGAAEGVLVASGAVEGVLVSGGAAESVLVSGGTAEGMLVDSEDIEGVLVIGADTVVAVDERILGKPSCEKEAAEMLESLSGGCHEVYTGVALLYWSRGKREVLKRRIFQEMTKVHFYPMSQEEISYYVSSGDCMDKAGAYGIQGLCARYIKGIEGDYNNVVGLPVGRLYQEMKRLTE